MASKKGGGQGDGAVGGRGTGASPKGLSTTRTTNPSACDASTSLKGYGSVNSASTRTQVSGDQPTTIGPRVA